MLCSIALLLFSIAPVLCSFAAMLFSFAPMVCSFDPMLHSFAAMLFTIVLMLPPRPLRLKDSPPQGQPRRPATLTIP